MDMASTVQKSLGEMGEFLAKLYLKEQGFQILECNWTFGKAEIDLIAKENEVLIFVEVKLRSYDYYGRPEEFVSPKQRRLIFSASQIYMEKNDHDWEIRFDVISILRRKNEISYDLIHYKDAFY